MAAPAISQLNMNGLEILNARFQNLSANPGSPSEALYYWNTVTKKLRVYDGTAWIDVGGGAGTVTSFSAGDLAPLFTTTETNPTTTPALSFSLSNASQNFIFAGPASGGAGAPSYRALAQADLPSSVPLSFWSAATANISLGGFKITNLADPTSAQEAATKAYVDQVASGLNVKTSVKAATTSNITLSGAQTIDAISIIAGDRVLVKNQSTASQNGIYVCAAGAWTRSTDMDAWAEFPSAFFFVEQGSTNADSGWVCTNDAGGTLGTTAVTFAQFSGAGQITAGAGLDKTGNTIFIGAGNDSITVNADSIQVTVDNSTIETAAGVGIRVKDGGITFPKIASGVWGSTLDTTGSVVNVLRYTPVSNFNVARVRIITTTLANGANTVTHSLGQQFVAAFILDASNRWVPVSDYVCTSASAITVQNDSTSFSATILIIG